MEARAAALGEKEEDDEVDADDDADDDDTPSAITVTTKKKLVVAGKSPVVAPPKISYQQIFPKNSSGEEIVREDYTKAELVECANTHEEWLKEIAEAWNIQWNDDTYAIVDAVLAAQGEMNRMTSSGESTENTLDKETLTNMKLRDLRLVADSLDIDHEDMSKEQVISAILSEQE
jgi:hypothetical protein